MFTKAVYLFWERGVSFSEAKTMVLRDSRAMVKDSLRSGCVCFVEKDKEGKPKHEAACPHSGMHHTACSVVDEEQGDGETGTNIVSRNSEYGATVNESESALVAKKGSSDTNDSEIVEVNCTDGGSDRYEKSRDKQLAGVRSEHHVSGEDGSERVMKERLKSLGNGERSGSGVREILEFMEGFFGSIMVHNGEELKVKEGREAGVA